LLAFEDASIEGHHIPVPDCPHTAHRALGRGARTAAPPAIATAHHVHLTGAFLCDAVAERLRAAAFARRRHGFIDAARVMARTGAAGAPDSRHASPRHFTGQTRRMGGPYPPRPPRNAARLAPNRRPRPNKAACSISAVGGAAEALPGRAAHTALTAPIERGC